jgi:hypothetical protein
MLEQKDTMFQCGGNSEAGLQWLMIVFTIEGFNEDVGFKIIHVTDILLSEHTVYMMLWLENRHMGEF